MGTISIQQRRKAKTMEENQITCISAGRKPAEDENKRRLFPAPLEIIVTHFLLILRRIERHENTWMGDSICKRDGIQFDFLRIRPERVMGLVHRKDLRTAGADYPRCYRTGDDGELHDASTERQEERGRRRLDTDERHFQRYRKTSLRTGIRLGRGAVCLTPEVSGGVLAIRWNALLDGFSYD